MGVRIPPVWTNVGFAVALLVVANLAWANAAPTTGPWFSAAVSIQVYSLTVLLALAIAVVLSVVALSRLGHIDAAARSLELRLEMNEPPAPGPSPPPPRDIVQVDMPTDDEVEDLLDAIADSMTEGLLQVEQARETPPKRADDPAAADRRTRRTVALLRREWEEIRGARSRIRVAAAGPVLASLAFLFLAAAMLPGSEGFAVQNFQLNTGLILFLAYGWVFLVAWGIAALASMPWTRASTEPS